MPLEAPRLDTRRFESLVAELRQRIPLYTPEWTDFNDSDPGMTLVQLFAWLTELQLVQMNRLPEANFIRFLQMLGFDLAPAKPAVAHVTFATSPDAAVVGPVVRGWQVSAQPADGGPPLIFESEEGMDLVRMPLVSVQAFNGATFSDVTAENESDGPTFMPFGWTAQAGSALYLGFDGSKLPAGARPFPSEVRLRVLLAPARPGTLRYRRAGGGTVPAPVELAWEYRPSSSARYWQRLDVFRDDSLAFTREGDIRIAGPARLDPMVEATEPRPLYWLRCRIVAGRYPSGQLPELDLILPNTLLVTNLVTVRDELVGISDGAPGQRSALEQRPVNDLVVETRAAASLEREPWVRVPDFVSSGPGDQHYVLHATRGEIEFGDGQRGRIPVAGTEIIAVRYRTGGGAQGNVPAGAINAPLTTPPGVKEVANRRPAVGGQAEQTVDELRIQAPQALRNKERAVASDDYVALAVDAGVHKAVAIPLMHPDFPGIEVPGAVTVAIVPDQIDVPPMPSDDLLEAVAKALEPRRVLTSEVFVRAPTYLPVRVDARVSAEPLAALDDVHRRVIAAVDGLLDPRERRFGDDLHPSALYRAILEVDDVTAVDHMRIFVGDREHDDLAAPIVVPRDGLVFGAPGHTFTVVRSQDR